MEDYIPATSQLGRILGPNASPQVRQVFVKLCKSLRSRTQEYKDQTELVAKFKDRLQEMEEVGASVQEEVNALRAKLLDASEINQVGEMLQQENEVLRREVSRLREHAPSTAPAVLQGSSSSRAKSGPSDVLPVLRGSAVLSVPRASRSTRSPDREMEELRGDVRRAYVIVAGLQRDVTRLRHLFIKGPRRVWADGYDQGWQDAPTRLTEFEELAFIKGWLSALREMQVPKNSMLWYRHEVSPSVRMPNPFRRDDQWIPIDAIPRQLLESNANEVEEEVAPHPDDGRRAQVADYLARRPHPH